MLSKTPKKFVPRVRSDKLKDKPKPKGFKVPPMLQAWAAQKGRTKANFFEPDLKSLHPPGVGPDPNETKLAMDEDVSQTLAWAQSAIQSVFAEGQTFLGYAFLAQLAQRAEYRRAATIMAEEMTRKWIKIQSTGDVDKTEQIKQRNDEMDRLQVRDRFKKIVEQNSYFGRAHLYIDLGTTDDREELKTPIGTGRNDVSRNKIRQGSLQRLKCVEAVWCYPTNYDSADPLRTDWYEPEMWYVMAKQIHVSRLLKFVAYEVPDLLKPAYSFGGLSLSQMGKPYVDNWLRTRQSVADLIHSFSVFVLKSNLSTSLQDGGEEFFKRLQMFVDLRDNRNVFVVDKDTEDLENKSAPLGSLDNLQSQTQEHMCAVWGIPTIKYLNIQPAGFNASSEGEIRTFYDSILALQESFFRPNLTKVIDFIMLSLWGEVDQEITFKFEPLWALDDEKLATKRKTEAETDVVLIDAGVVSVEESRERVAADPDSPYSSIDVDDMPEPPQEEDGGNEEGGDDVIPFAQDDDAAWDEFVEQQYPRVKGGENSGQFAPKGGASGYSGKGGKKKIAHELFSKGVSQAELMEALGWTKPVAPSTVASHLGMKLEKYKENGVTKYKAIQSKQEETKAPATPKESFVAPKQPEPKSEKEQIEEFHAKQKEGVAKFSPKFTAALAGVTSTPDTLNHAKEIIKLAVQSGDATIEAAKVMLTDKEKQLLTDNYGSVEKTYEKAQGYFAQQQQNEKASAEAKAKQEQAAKEAAEKAEKAKQDFLKSLENPSEKKHFEVLVALHGETKYAQNYLKHAASQIKEAGLEGKITPGEAAQIIAYSGSSYMGVNEQLRAGAITKSSWAYAKALNAALDKLPARPGVTLRGSSIPSSELHKYQPGVVIEERAFTSTGMGKKFGGDVTFEIHGKTGRDISKLSSHPNEKEVLFKMGSRFEVMSRSGNHIVMHEVDYEH